QWAVARDMTGGPTTVRMSTDKTRYAHDEDVAVTMQLAHPNGGMATGAKPRVLATQDGRALATTALVEDSSVPGTYRATIKGLAAGQIHLQAQGSDVDDLLKEEAHVEPVMTTIAVDPPDSPELRDTRC